MIRNVFASVLFLFTSVLSILPLALGTGCSNPYTLLQRADSHTQQKKYDEAIEAYRKHIAFRLKVEGRPDWENPYFHLLQIGDLLILQDKVSEALSTYEEAEKHNVDPVNVSDRFRFVASYFERQGKLEEALKVLTTYRERDPFLYDLVRDRIGKELLSQEGGSQASPLTDLP